MTVARCRSQYPYVTRHVTRRISVHVVRVRQGEARLTRLERILSDLLISGRGSDDRNWHAEAAAVSAGVQPLRRQMGDMKVR